jgi:hypothetical protein
MTQRFLITLALLVTYLVATGVAQVPVYPKEIRGYKVERAVVELKKDPKNPATDADEGSLLRLGDPQLVRATPLGISLEVPIIVSAVKQKGHVDFLIFEDVVVNGTSVEIDEYQREFDLPNKKPLTLKEPLKFYIYLPGVVFAALDEWSNSKETWLITGRVYVFGKFNKSIFKFKRCIPIELKMSVPNPLRNSKVSDKL